MKDEKLSEGLQFDRAETPAGPPPCTVCNQTIGGTYYDINGKVLCELCRHGVEQSLARGSSVSRFTRAFFYGLGAAVVGAGIYYAVLALTGYQVGIVAVVVGWLVGEAVRRGSGGRGGWAYQTLAVFLTYGSIVSTYVPMVVEEMKQQATATGKPDTPQPSSAETPPPELTLSSAVLAFALLFVVAFIAPFLAGLENIIGLVIIGIGLFEAWRRNKRVVLQISGPFQVGASSS